MKNWKGLTVYGILIILVLNVLSLSSCDNLFPEKTPGVFKIKNNTGDLLAYLYLKEPGSSVWGTSFSSPYIPNGSSTLITIPKDRMDSQYRIDIQLRTSNGNLYTKLSQTLTHEGTVTFTSGDLDSSSPRTVNLGNTTGNLLAYVYLREPGALIWGTSFSSPYIPNGGSTSITIPYDRMDSQYKTDIQLRTSNGNMYTMLSQPITHRGTITFTSTDLDSGSSRTITLGNTTGDLLAYVYLREPGALIWGTSFSSPYISNGGSTSITIPYDRMDSQYKTDIQLRTSNGNMYTKLSQLITHNGNVTFTSSDLDSSSPRTITIGNITGDLLAQLYLRVPSTSSWGTSFSSPYISNGGSTSITIPYDRMDSQYRTDIQLRTSGGITYTKTYQTITHKGTVNFSSSDKD